MNTQRLALPTWMTRWSARREAHSSTGTPSTLLNSRLEVCPPQTWASSLSWKGRWQRFIANARWLPAPARPLNRLAAVKCEFLLQLSDLSGQDVQVLGERIARASSLRELWHLRSPMYGVLAVHSNQSEADRRLALLNRYFPVRAPRNSTLMALEP